MEEQHHHDHPAHAHQPDALEPPDPHPLLAPGSTAHPPEPMAAPLAPAYVPEPAPTPAAPPAPPAPAAVRPPTSAVQIVWQWLCYSLWEAALLALSIFLSSVLAYFLVGGSSSNVASSFSIYSFAAVLCLLPFAYFADVMYRKREPAEKHGFAAVVMVLNAVLVFLVMLGGLITAVVSTLSIVVNGNGTSSLTTTIISSLIVTVLGAMLFVRVLSPARIARQLKLFPMVVSGVAVVAIVFAVAGPFRSLIGTRDDRLIEDNLTTVNSAIQDYAQANGHLPITLSDLNFDNSYQSGAKTLVSRKLVSYTRGASSSQYSPYTYQPSELAYTTNYTLCVTFKKAKGQGGGHSKADIYGLSIQHGAGQQCFNESYTNYNATTNNTKYLSQ